MISVSDRAGYLGRIRRWRVWLKPLWLNEALGFPPLKIQKEAQTMAEFLLEIAWKKFLHAPLRFITTIRKRVADF